MNCYSQFFILFFINYLNLIVGIQFNCILSFGDSLTDIGNTDKISLGIKPGPKYYNGRHSNGPVWVEYLQQFLNVSSMDNRAFGAATTSNQLTSINPFVPGAQAQIDSLEVLPPINCEDPVLVTYMAGGDDYVNATVKPQQVIQDIENQLNQLIRKKFTNILLFNLPPINQTPNFSKPKDSSLHSYRKYHDDHIGEKVQMHNELLLKLYNELKPQHPDVNLMHFDTYELWPILLKSNPFNVTNWDFESPCFNEKSGEDPCKEPNSFFFYDTFHPTTGVHKEIAKNILKFLKHNT